MACMSRWIQLVLLLIVTKNVSCSVPPRFVCADQGCNSNRYRNMEGFYLIENKEVGDYLYTLEAEDPDGGSVTYAIVPTDPSSIKPNQKDGIDYLDVNSTTGVVTLKQEVDYEQFNRLIPTWKLTDSNSEMLTLETTINIENVNDNDPEFSSSRYQPDPILENSVTSDYVISTVTASDADDDSGIKYSITDSHGLPCNTAKFEIEEISGNISLKANEELDFEKGSRYTICVEVTDSGKPDSESEKRSGFAQVIVSVQDAQDTKPQFTSSNYNQKISENEPVGFKVVSVQAIDGDRGVLAPNEMLYMLSEGDGKFEIDNSTGEISLKEMLDRETKATYTVTVEAQEVLPNGSFEAEPSSDKINIIFQVIDVDDEQAEFSTSSVNVMLQENSLIGSFVPLDGLTVSDGDETPNNKIVLSLIGPDADAFESRNPDIIFGQAAVDIRVFNKTKLDFEVNRILSFEINAADVLGNISDTVYVNITLLDENDETPEFSKSQYTFNVTENSKGDFVGSIYATDADSAMFSQVTYKLYGLGNTPQFQLNTTTGEISTRDDANLDYEGQSVYFFTCVATDSQRTGTATIEIKLLDENDNTPEFKRDYTARVDENKVPNMPLLMVSASDEDKSEMNKAITFSLLNTSLSEKFSIDSKSGDLTLNEALDYEQDGPVVKLTVIATDGGVAPRNDSALIKVTIQDMNDHAPDFTQAFYSGNVSEEASRGAVVLIVSAIDGDRPNSVNSRIDYFFDDISVSDFRIGIASGEITVNSVNLDREDRGMYELKINAIDRGEPSMNGSCFVRITLLDSNNKPPQINETLSRVEVSEDVAVGFSVTTVMAFDPDETANLVYSIKGIIAVRPDGTEIRSDLSDMFTIDNSTGVIFIAKRIDRENQVEFKITITVEDVNGEVETPQIAKFTLTIVVIDVNDNAPQFTPRSNFQFTVPENVPIGYVISPSFSAIDLDDGENGKVQFDLEDDVDSILKIDPRTGLLTVNGTLDREKYATYSATIVVRDNGIPPLSSNETIVITLTDVNDNAPEFDLELNTTAIIEEDYSSETPILQVVAYDSDKSEEFGTVTYEITAGDPQELFNVNSTTGWIMIRKDKTLDRETEDKHILTISASDGNRQETIQVTIDVLDVNDNKPKFPSDSLSTSIQESVFIDYVVTTVKAKDKDQSNTENTEIEYFISGGNEEDYFIMETESGELRTNASLSNRVGDFVLTIIAMDKGTPPLVSKPLTLTVTVTDVNDDTPEIKHPGNLDDFLIPEDYTGFVLNVTAIDTDRGLNGELDFEFIETVGDDDFKAFNFIPSMDYEDTAMLFILEKTDREKKAKYSLQVKVSDRGLEHYSSSVSFTVSVLDSDDNEPLFWTDPKSRPKAEFSVPENDDSASLGFVNLATDADEPINQHIYYFIVDGNKEDQFVLNKTTGELSLQKSLDRESNATFDLVVKVTSNINYMPLTPIPYDQEDNTLLQVTVTVLDKNDNGPVFLADNKEYTGGAKYSAEYQSQVINVAAEDRDINENSKVVFSIVSQTYIDTAGIERPQEAFGINPTTGSIFTLKTFSRGDEGYFTLKVEARDKLNPDFKDTARVLIYLYSENQQVRLTFSKTPEEIRITLDGFTATIELIIVKYGDFSQNRVAKRQVSVTPEVVVDDIQVLTVNNQPVQGQSVMEFHAVNIEDNTNIAPAIIVNAIDSAFDYTQTIRGEYGVNQIEFAAPTPVPPVDLSWLQWVLVAVVFVLLLTLVALGAMYCFMKSRFRTQLRAATVYEKIGPTTKASNPAPNTNLYTKPGSNPVFGSNVNVNEGFENDYGTVPDEEGEIKGKKDSMRNGHVTQANDSPSEEQEIILDMLDDSADHEEIVDEERGDRMIMQLLQDYDNEKTNLQEFGNMSITEI